MRRRSFSLFFPDPDLVFRSFIKRIGWKGLTIIGVMMIAGATYLFLCIQLSIALNRGLEPLRDHFSEVADTTRIRVIALGPDQRIIDCGGRLDPIIEARNRIVSDNDAFMLGSWKLFLCTGGRGVMTLPAFVYNPRLKIDLRKIDSEIPSFLNSQREKQLVLLGR